MPPHPLAAPRHVTGEPVTGADKDKLRLHNKRVRKEKQRTQHLCSYWQAHQGLMELPPYQQRDSHHRNEMAPGNLALYHPAADLLLDYATKGCPTRTGKFWSTEEMEAAIARGPHPSALQPDALRQLRQETLEKVEKGQARLVRWRDIKANPPRELKISPIAMIPHKSRGFRAILDLSFNIRLHGRPVPSVNESTIKTAPSGALDQMGHALSRIIHAFTEAPADAKIFLAKWDIKDGFWRLDCEDGQEWNFAYVLPPESPSSDVQLVVPTSLQMGWMESPPYFCAASETARDVAAQYLETPIGSLCDNKFISWAMDSEDFRALPVDHLPTQELSYIVEVYMDDYIGLAMPASQDQLRHAANAIMHGIHDVFPANEQDSDDPISLKKLRKGDGSWMLRKDILGFTFDGDAKTLWLESPKRDILLTVLHKWLRASRVANAGIAFDEFESVTATLRHALTAIPAGKGLLSPCNRLLRKRPPFVFLHRNKPLQTALADIRTLLRESTLAPTKCYELVADWPDFVGVKDASKHGVGGFIVGEAQACTPTVFRMEWPEDIKADIISSTNPSGRLTNSDLEMAGLLLLWLIMEDVCGVAPGCHVALFSDNSPTVGWVTRMAAKRSLVAAQLLRALALRLKTKGASPLTPFHVAGCENAMADIPSRSWGSEPQWTCKTDNQLLTLFNLKFPLPTQMSWSVYRPSFAICMRVISVLRMRAFSMEEWRRLPEIGTYIGAIGPRTPRLWEWTLTFRRSPSKIPSVSSPGLPPESAAGTTVEDTKSLLAQSVKLSRPLARRSLWSEV